MQPLSDRDQLDNGILFLELYQKLNAYGVGNVNKFFAVQNNWRCPCCHRSKPEIARLDKNGHLLCGIVEHHDHYTDMVSDKIPSPRFKEGDADAVRSVWNSFQRFPPTLICEDCNVVEPATKALVDASAAFTFAPYEIMQFVEVTVNRWHTINRERCYEVYEAALCSVKVMSVHLRGVVGGMKEDDAAFIPIGEAAVRVLKNARILNAKSEAEGTA